MWDPLRGGSSLRWGGSYQGGLPLGGRDPLRGVILSGGGILTIYVLHQEALVCLLDTVESQTNWPTTYLNYQLELERCGS